MFYLFLVGMNKPSKHTILLLLLYVFIAAILTMLVIRHQRQHPEPTPPARHSAKKPGDKLQPHEFFYFDRQYPAAEFDHRQYRKQWQQSIAHDRRASRTHRGLDHPWTVQGPGNLGGRVNAIAVHPTDPQTILIGYSQGGIYLTTDGGGEWMPVFDDQPSLSISHITYDPHVQDRLWATTGDVNISGYPFLGTGIYRSDNGGENWAYTGLDNTGVLSKVIPDPFTPGILYVGSMGYPSHKGNERGLFRTTDGGASWQKTLTVDDSTGIIDVVTDPMTPGRVFASAWTRIRNNTKGTTTGPGTGLYKSEDYGNTWTNITQDLPAGNHSRTGVEIANDGTLFMSYIGTVNEGECGGYRESLQGIYTSVDGGMNWDTIPASPQHGLPCQLFGQFGWYFEVLKVNPDNPKDMFLLGVDIYRTLDGGLSWFPAAPEWWWYEVHADKHDLVFAHGHLYLGTDGGAYRTDINQGSEWIDIENIPSTQFYRVAWSPHQPEAYFGGAQDNGTTGGHAGFINEWPRIFGGDGFQPRFDPDEPTWMYALTQNGSVWFYEDDISGWRGLNRGLTGTRYWDMPLEMSHHQSKILYCGSSKVHRINMLDEDREWREISPDLTRGDTILGTRYPAITAIAESPVDPMRLYAGTQDGLIWTTPDGGQSWTNISDGTPGFYVTSITCSTVDPLVVYATYSGYRDNDHQPYIYRSADAGATWVPVAADLPMLGVNAFLILPGWNDAVLFAATDGGVYVSLTAGNTWERLGTNMPYMPVYDIDYHPIENTIIAGTFSRGIMTFPVEELELISSVGAGPVAHSSMPIDIFPTLATDHVFVKALMIGSSSKEAWISISDLRGRVVRQVQALFSGNDPVRLSLPQHMVPGMYLVQVSTSQSSGSGRVIVQ